MATLIAIALAISCFMMLRSFLVVVGIYKDPILASFEVYGDEKIYSPLYNLILWSIAFVYLALFLYVGSGILLVALFLAIPLSYFYRLYQRLLQEHPDVFRRLPGWYAELVVRTDREERRRIAYLWLRLPVRTRLLYNARSEFFLHWVDQVLMTIA